MTSRSSEILQVLAHNWQFTGSYSWSFLRIARPQVDTVVRWTAQEQVSARCRIQFDNPYAVVDETQVWK